MRPEEEEDEEDEEEDEEDEEEGKEEVQQQQKHDHHQRHQSIHIRLTKNNFVADLWCPNSRCGTCRRGMFIQPRVLPPLLVSPRCPAFILLVVLSLAISSHPLPLNETLPPGETWSSSASAALDQLHALQVHSSRMFSDANRPLL
jgi:hypothetical protein